MKKLACKYKNSKSVSNKLPLTSSAVTQTSSFGIKIAITSLFVIIFGAPMNEAAVIQAVIEIDDGPEDFVKLILEKMDYLIEAKKNTSNQVHNISDTETHFNIGSSTLMSISTAAFGIGHTFMIHGNVTDNKENPKSIIRFQIYTEATNSTSTMTGIRPFSDYNDNGNKDLYNSNSNIKDDDSYYDEFEDEDEKTYYKSNGGLFNPIVKTVEPYVLTLLNIIFHGIMTSVISKMMDNANMTGDIRLA